MRLTQDNINKTIPCKMLVTSQQYNTKIFHVLSQYIFLKAGDVSEVVLIFLTNIFTTLVCPLLSSPQFDFNNMRSDSNTILYSVIIKSLSAMLDRKKKSIYFILFVFNMNYLSLGLEFLRY